jgi:RNA polymerase sigma-70 factor (ECF subfamily)
VRIVDALIRNESNPGVTEPCGLDFTEMQRLGDDALMVHLQRGHKDALAILFDRYHRLVFTVALKILRDVSEAEDAMQAIFLEIYRRAAQFDAERGSTKVWILQYAYHRSINRRQYLEARSFYTAADIDEVNEDLPELSCLAAPAIEARHLVAQALATLSANQKKFIQLAYFEGLSFQEMAEQTGDTVDSVKHHYYRGLSKLRAFIAEQEKGRMPIRREILDTNA